MYEQQIAQTANTESKPALNLIFDGLFFLCFNTDGKPDNTDPVGECRVGFLTVAPQHLITISGKQTTVVGGVEVTKEFKKILTHAEARSMQIDINVPGVQSPSVTRKGHALAIDRANPTETTKEYFKWLIDLESFELHNTKLPLIPNVLKPVMHINIGEFYTKELSLVKYFRTKVDTANADFGNVAAISGVRITTLPQNKAFLKIGAATLDLVTQPGETSEVIFQNRCPKCDEKKLGDLHLSDFPLHYHAFDVKVLDQYDFDYPGVSAFPPAICYAAGGSQTTDI